MRFCSAYEQAAVENFEQQLTKKAEQISKRCSTYFIDNASVEWFNYLILLSEVDGTEIWSVSNPNANFPLGANMSIGLDVTALTEEYIELAQCAFANKKEVRTKYSSIHESTIVMVGVPVTGINGEIAGAIILNAPVATQKEVVSSSWSMMFISGMVALVVAGAVAIPFAKRLTQPIIQMRSTALLLAAGDYEAKTGIERYDEIGE